MAVSSNKKDSGMVFSLLLAAGVVSALVGGVESFSPSGPLSRNNQQQHFVPSTIHGKALVGRTATVLAAEGGKKKRRRKRKKAPPTDADFAAAPVAPSSSEDEIPATFEGEEINVEDIKDVASFAFGGPSGIDADSAGAVDETASLASSSVQQQDGSIPLPDIKETLRRKKMEVKKGPMEDAMPKQKIDRKDRTALLKLLEQDPYADGDDSFFEEQEYTAVSALLGERAKPFLGIPIGPLQVGHFIGALVIVLMAFIEYPGFPLTNLPSPLRGALQGGLGTIYGINAILAVVAAFKAGERGQPAQLWIAKVFTVGGLAFDQLTQLPTLEQVEAAKARKGKRALKNMRK